METKQTVTLRYIVVNENEATQTRPKTGGFVMPDKFSKLTDAEVAERTSAGDPEMVELHHQILEMGVDMTPPTYINETGVEVYIDVETSVTLTEGFRLDISMSVDKGDYDTIYTCSEAIGELPPNAIMHNAALKFLQSEGLV